MKKVAIVGLLLMLAATLLSGCYINSKVEEYEVGLRLDAGVRITDGSIVPAGRYTAMGFFDKLATVDVSAKTLTWEDPDLVTGDKQPVGYAVFVMFHRDRTAVSDMWTNFNAQATSDEALQAVVLGKIPRVVKAVSTQYSLDESLGIKDSEEALESAVKAYGREKVAADLFDLLAKELGEVHIVLDDLGINNIQPSDAYLDLLEEKANAQLGVEVAKAQTTMLNEKLLQEQAQTLVELEIARRQRQVAQEQAKVYETNPGWLRLQIWEAAKEVFNGDNVWFIDPNADLTLLFGGDTEVLPYEQ